MVNHHEYLKKEVERQNKNQKKLENEILDTKKLLNDKNLDLKSKDTKILEYQKSMLKDKNDILNKLEIKKLKLDSTVDTKLNRYKYVIVFLIILYYSIFFGSYYNFGWDTMEGIIWIGTVAVPFGFSVIYSLLQGSDFEFKDILKIKKEQIKEKVYKENDFDLEDIHKLELEIEKIKSDINEQ